MLFRSFVIVRTLTAGPLQLPQRAAERIEFLLIGQLLPFGKFHQFQGLFHLVQCLSERLHHLAHFIQRLADGRSL